MKGYFMSKELSEMTNEELWQLFPIILSEPNMIEMVIRRQKLILLK
jgi:hypothetical protein